MPRRRPRFDGRGSRPGCCPDLAAAELDGPLRCRDDGDQRTGCAEPGSGTSGDVQRGDGAGYHVRRRAPVPVRRPHRRACRSPCDRARRAQLGADRRRAAGVCVASSRLPRHVYDPLCASCCHKLRWRCKQVSRTAMRRRGFPRLSEIPATIRRALTFLNRLRTGRRVRGPRLMIKRDVLRIACGSFSSRVSRPLLRIGKAPWPSREIATTWSAESRPGICKKHLTRGSRRRSLRSLLVTFLGKERSRRPKACRGIPCRRWVTSRPRCPWTATPSIRTCGLWLKCKS